MSRTRPLTRLGHVTDYVLAVDLGGTKVEAALVDSDGAVLPGSRHRRPTGHTADTDALARSVTEAVVSARDAANAAAHPVTVIGAGVGSAGPISGTSGKVSPLNLPAWRDYPLGALVGSLLPGVPVVVRIDGIAITLAETWVGAAQGERNVMGMVVSTGVGGGLLVDGRTISGPSGNAGHIGHVQVAGHDTRCACGARGCLEAIASGPRTVRWAQEQGWNGATGEQLATSAREGDTIARAAIVRSAEAVGQAIASTSALLDLDVVAIGGGFSHVSGDYIDLVAATVAGHSDFGFVTSTRVVASGLSGEGPLIGAAALIHHAEQVA